MKRFLSLLLILAMTAALIACSGLSAGAQENEEKASGMLETYLKENGYKDYKYEEIGSGKYWTLFYVKCEGNACDKLIKGTFGDRMLINYADGQPFTFGYGVFQRRVGFFPLTQVWNDPYFEGLQDTFFEYTNKLLKLGDGTVRLIGDADGDGELSILDATAIQKRLVNLEEWPSFDSVPMVATTGYGADILYLSDVDRDGVRSVIDATWIQKKLAYLLKDTELAFRTLANVTSSESPILSRDARMIVSDKQLFEQRDTLLLFGENFTEEILARCDEGFFENCALLMFTDDETSSGYRRENFRVYRDKNFEIDFEQDMVFPSGSGAAVMTNRLILLALERREIPEIVTVNPIVYPKSPSDETYLSVSLTDSFHTGAVAVDGPSVAWKETYNGNSDEQITDFDDLKKFGVMALLTSRPQYEAFMREYGKREYVNMHPDQPEDYLSTLEDIYDDAFFEKYALVVTVYRYVFGSYTTKVIATAVRDNTLYVALRTTNVPEEPHAAPIYSYNISVNMLKKTEVSSIRALSLLLMREE